MGWGVAGGRPDTWRTIPSTSTSRLGSMCPLPDRRWCGKYMMECAGLMARKCPYSFSKRKWRKSYTSRSGKKPSRKFSASVSNSLKCIATRRSSRFSIRSRSVLTR
uniref:Uncharacterized protein n=1 Tax=Cacopsylla melanoneura TaxID=428564 RepID=A0A8D8MHX8_9HEMI